MQNVTPQTRLAVKSATQAAPAAQPFAINWPGFAAATAYPGAAFTAGLPGYAVDALQRGVLFLDLLRQRGNEEVEITSRPLATVLRFEHEPIMSGRSLVRPTNYALSRIVPPPGVVIDEHKRPVVVVDPRAGQGPGIGGFKADSEIGDALAAGHPVYFIGFGAEPVPGQQFLDVVEGQVKFFERVVALHPDAPRPFAIGNCQAGYQTLMGAVLRPDLYGPCLVAGSPMSYWQGVHGKNPMRYAGGLNGGSWMTALASDLGHGKFDGTALIQNFDSLNPANWLWGKQYEVYTHIDTDAKRYLQFEKWWGDFIQLGGDEIQFLVDNLFIGDKLTRNQLQAHDGTTFDLRNITSPVIVFTSMGDNISPPPQTLGWIIDLYRDVEAIRASGRTIVYCVNQEVGHLGLFVSSKVGAKEDEEFVQLMDVIDCLPPGLHEMLISPRPAEVPTGGFVTGDWTARFEPRTLDDIRALGRNSAEDDRAFAAAARLSERNLALYRTFVQPLVRAVVTEQGADWVRQMNPLRLGYTLFADTHPWMKGVQALAASVKAERLPVADDNPLLALQAQVSARITAALEAYRVARDQMSEQMFFAIYGSPFVQALLGISADEPVRPLPADSPDRQQTRQQTADSHADKLRHGGFDEALTRAVLYATAAERVIEQRCALALNVARQQVMHLPLAEFKTVVREQFAVLQAERERAVDAIADMVTKADARKQLLEQVREIVAAGGPPNALETERLDRLTQLLSGPSRKPIALVRPRRGAGQGG
jgi:hypothetical protein